MDTAEYLCIGIMLVMLLLSAFFSGSEAAFLSLRQTRISVLLRDRVKGAERIAKIAGRPEKLLPTVLTGNNITNTALAALGTALIATRLDAAQSVIVSTAVVTIALLIFAEIIPKTIAARHAERFALLAVRPLQWAGYILFPAVWILERLAGRMARLFGVSDLNKYTGEEIRAMIFAGKEAGEVEPSQAEILEHVLRFFGDRQLRSVMTPRPEIIALEESITLSEFLETYSKHRHTRFPVYEYNLDNVIGTLSVKDVVQAIATDNLSLQDKVAPLIREAYFVPETKLAGSIFPELRVSTYQMIILVDEFGGIAGLVTLKQLMEEIVGKVGEEGVVPKEEFQAIDANTYQIEGGMDINEANDRIGFGIPLGDYETVAGFILSRLGHIPITSERLTHNDFVLQVTEMSGVRIEQVTATHMPKRDGDGNPIPSLTDSHQNSPEA
jgi:putative hemolysin